MSANPMQRFLHDETGAITVDWVVLTAAVVAITLVFANPIFEASAEMGVWISGEIETAKNN